LILVVSRRPIGANSPGRICPPLQPRYDAPVTSTRKGAGCSGRAGFILHRRAGGWQARWSGLPPRAKELELYEIDGGPTDCRFRRVPPVEMATRRPERSATESPRCEGALVSRAAFDFNLRWVKSADRGSCVDFKHGEHCLPMPHDGSEDRVLACGRRARRRSDLCGPAVLRL
jgi:hypothetical protein